MNLTDRLLDHFSIEQGAQRTGFFWKTFVEYFVVILVIGFLLSPFDLESRDDFNDFGPVMLFANAVLLAPPLETLLFQSLTCVIARALKLKPAAQMAVMYIPFALAHFAVAVSTGLRAGCVLGFYLAFVYSVCRRRSFENAFWTTTALHALNNAVFVSLALIFD